MQTGTDRQQETSGLIRFVGGPLHNRVLNVRWRPSICVPQERERRALAVANDCQQFIQTVFELAIYRLELLCTPASTSFYEYWLAGSAVVWTRDSDFNRLLNTYDFARYGRMDPARG